MFCCPRCGQSFAARESSPPGCASSQLDVFDARPLTAEQVTELERLLPKDAFSGPRYPDAMMAHLDSEK